MTDDSAKPTVSDPRPPSVATGMEPLLSREWLVTNGLGGYASGTACGVATRRYHGLLIAALQAPLGRVMRLNQVGERLILADGTSLAIGVDAVNQGGAPGAGHLAHFALESGLPVWRYEVRSWVIEKRVVMPHLQNTTYVTYRLLSTEEDQPIQLMLRPAVHFRSHDAPVDAPHVGPYRFSAQGDQYEIAAEGFPPLRLFLSDSEGRFILDATTTDPLDYVIEAGRGYEHRGELWSPGYFLAPLETSAPVTLVASTETWNVLQALSAHEAQQVERTRRARLLRLARSKVRGGVAGELVGAADQFLITPSGRVEDTARAHAAGEEIRTVIAGYHWFTDWGRDTMISLEGLTLTTGRLAEAGYILRTFAYYVRDGLIPNLFPEGQTEGLYHTADATLWFFHAIDRYLEASGDQETLHLLLPTLLEIVAHHRQGTRFGIGVDPADGLLRQGAEGYQLTWMDAKVDGWVLTPRRGKAVEINALWYNALKLLEGWVRTCRDEEAAAPLAEQAEQARRSFNDRFWYAEGEYLYDIVDGEAGDDPACRPNQLLAISLRHPVLARERWEPVVEVARRRLLTPVGLRSLAPGHPDYKPVYHGDLRSRDAAYHQGTVWAWLIGPFIDAWLKVHPNDRAGARRFLDGFIPHLQEACLGSISEIFDAEPPFQPRGCIAQAWSIAEVIRCWVKTEPEPQ